MHRDPFDYSNPTDHIDCLIDYFQSHLDTFATTASVRDLVRLRRAIIHAIDRVFCKALHSSHPAHIVDFTPAKSTSLNSNMVEKETTNV